MAVIRPGVAGDLVYLPEIEAQAALRLRDIGLTELHDLFAQHVTSAQSFEHYLRAGHVWVAVEDQRPVGFIVISTCSGYAHIDEVDVLPDYSRQGIGRALINTACAWVLEQGITHVTLSTQANVPWNRSYYEKLGFAIIPPEEWTPAHQQIRAAEATLGFPMADRVLMKKTLGAKE